MTFLDLFKQLYSPPLEYNGCFIPYSPTEGRDLEEHARRHLNCMFGVEDSGSYNAEDFQVLQPDKLVFWTDGENFSMACLGDDVVMFNGQSQKF